MNSIFFTCPQKPYNPNYHIVPFMHNIYLFEGVESYYISCYLDSSLTGIMKSIAPDFICQLYVLRHDGSLLGMYYIQGSFFQTAEPDMPLWPLGGPWGKLSIVEYLAVQMQPSEFHSSLQAVANVANKFYMLTRFTSKSYKNSLNI